MKNEKLRVLWQFFGIEAFRPGQEEAIDALLRGRDVLSVMPTGAGKSLCYELPALLLPGLTLVISPLIALMDDQVQHLRNRRIPAAAVHSGIPRPAVRRIFEDASAGRLKLLYISPERLRSPSFRRLLPSLSVSVLCIDEAHCVLSWGRSFRPAYRKIPAIYDVLPVRPRVIALTATASLADQERLISLLCLRDPVRIATGFARPNLSYETAYPPDKFAAARAFLLAHRGESGIIYCKQRRSAEDLAANLTASGISCTAYHAGLPAAKRETIQRGFLSGEIRLLASTNAFGMGIDKKDVRFVLHYELPLTIEDYYQEAGRAGRDRKPADCLLLYDPHDLLLARRFAGTGKARAEEREKLRALQQYASGRQCFPQYLSAYFGEKVPPCGKCSACKKRISYGHLTGRAHYLDMDARQSELYAELLDMRKSCAKEKNLRADRIATDAFLRALVFAMPTRLWECLLIDGVRAAWLPRLRPLLEVIRAHKDFYGLA